MAAAQSAIAIGVVAYSEQPGHSRPVFNGCGRAQESITFLKIEITIFNPSIFLELYIMHIKEIHQLFKVSAGVCTDTRHLQKGQLFFALKGDHFNGNLYAEKALEMGAAYSIVDEKEGHDERLILVENVLATLQQLAAFHRSQKKIPVIAITGSNGKTTTKELIHAVLAKKYNTVATIGNLNNHIGVPLSLLTIKDDTEIAIIEMGANHIGEIASYCEWTVPDYGLITNIGLAHLEGFGSPEGVRKGKNELYTAVMANEGTLFVNSDDEVLKQLVRGYPNLFTYGSDASADVQGMIDHTGSGSLSLLWRAKTIKTQLAGEYNFMNAMSAIAIGVYFNIHESAIIAALEEYSPDNNRSQIKVIGTNTFILDAYNANPSSLKLAIENFAGSKGEHKMVIIGEMKEMGSYSKEMHRDILNLIRKYKFDKIVLVGKEFESLLNENEGLYFADNQEAKKWWQHAGIQNHIILMKGSRGMALEKILADQNNLL